MGQDRRASWLPIKCALKKVVIAFDADDAGAEEAAKLAPVLGMFGTEVRCLKADGAKDWNEMLERRGAEELGDWLFHAYSAKPI